MSKKNDSMTFGLGLLAGVIGGIFAGVLFAPQKGEDSRKEVKDAICNFVETQSPSVKDAKKQAAESIDLIKYKLEKQLRRFANFLQSKKMVKAKELEDSEYDFN